MSDWSATYRKTVRNLDYYELEITQHPDYSLDITVTPRNEPPILKEVGRTDLTLEQAKDLATRKAYQ